MEPLVAFGVILVVYCAGITLADVLRDRPAPRGEAQGVPQSRFVVRERRRAAAVRGRGGSAAARCPVRAAGSA
ncbi:hypothetical protein GEO60473_30080 [Geobacter sp. 60473]|nr:hypothetical protein GEO60473_30080 [Geobacter sp. 60473]